VDQEVRPTEQLSCDQPTDLKSRPRAKIYRCFASELKLHCARGRCGNASSIGKFKREDRSLQAGSQRATPCHPSSAVVQRVPFCRFHEKLK
jgi:hypothetical protein